MSNSELNLLDMHGHHGGRGGRGRGGRGRGGRGRGSGGPLMKVAANIITVKRNGWGVAEISKRYDNHEAGLHAEPGQTIAIMEKKMMGLSVDDAVFCEVKHETNPRNAEDWFAVKCNTARERTSQVSWEPWQTSMVRKLPSTEPGSDHTGITLACWKCGTATLSGDDGHIERIKNSAVWTGTFDLGAQGMELSDKIVKNKFKRCNTQSVLCIGCCSSLGSYYKEPYYDSDTKTLKVGQPFPCAKLTTIRKDKTFDMVLKGDVMSEVQDAVAVLTRTDEWLKGGSKLAAARGGGRVDATEYSARLAAKATAQQLQERQNPKRTCSLMCSDVCGIGANEELRLSDGIDCPTGDSDHFVCSGCFGDYVRSEATTDKRDLLQAREGFVCCPSCPNAQSGGQGAIKYTDVQVAKVCNAAQFSVYTAGKMSLLEERLVQEIGQAEKARFEAELAKLQAMTEGQREVDVARRKLETLLNLKCPRCKQVFIDFDACMALSCAKAGCGAAFCGWCQADCGSDAHSHVRNCPKKPAGADMFFDRENQRFDVWKRMRGEAVTTFLGGLEERLRPKVVQVCARMLRDAGVGAVVDRFSAVDMQLGADLAMIQIQLDYDADLARQLQAQEEALLRR